MKLNKLLVAFLVFILLVSSVYAPDGDSSGSDYDYGSDDSYSDPDFYSNSDPSQWDYSKVDWERVDFNRAELYSSSEFYNNIPDDRYGDLDYKQVEYSQIKDHSKIDSAKYFQDMGCSSCSLDRGGQNVFFSKNGITHPNGNSVSVPGTYPSGSLFVATENRIEVVVPEGAETINVPTTDTVTVNTQGRDVTLADGTRVNGKVISDNGQIRVKKEDKATINGIDIESRYSSEAEYVDVFSDGRNCGTDCISFSKDSKSLFINQNKGFQLTFQKDNPVLNIEDSDFFRIGQSSNIQLQITNRDEQDLIPQIVAKKLTEDAEFRFVNGNIAANIDRENRLNQHIIGVNWNYLDLTDVLREKTTTPMTLNFQDNEGNNLLGTETEPHKILISNYNELISIPLELETVETRAYDQAPAIISERLSFNTMEGAEFFNGKAVILPINDNQEITDAVSKNPGMLVVSGVTDPSTLKKISETYQALPPQIKASINGFQIYSDEEWSELTNEIFGENNRVAGWTSADGIIRLPASGISESLIYHEGAHDLTFELERQREMELAQKNFLSKFGSDVYATFTREFRRGGVWETDFEAEWKNIVNENYGENVVVVDGYNTWKEYENSVYEFEAHRPRDGFVRPYGATDYYEDVATYVENVRRDPSFFKPLISESTYDTPLLSLETSGATPLYFKVEGEGSNRRITSWSPDEDNWMSLEEITVSGGKYDGKKPTQTNQNIIQELSRSDGGLSSFEQLARDNLGSISNAMYDPRYEKKLKLLYDHGFITKEDYERIVGN
jgi:hypothetical protein